MAPHILMSLDELPDGAVRIVGIAYRTPPYRSVIVTRIGDSIGAYWNVCRHLPVPLDGGMGAISQDGKGRWVCETHGARYRPEDGLCVEGPCRGERLTKIAVRVEDGMIVMDLD